MRKRTLLMVSLLALGASPGRAENTSVRINFQPANVPTPAGDVPDSGETFADRGNGLSYGWDGSHVSRARYYPPPFPGMNLRYWTLIEMSSASSAKWEIALPNGSYRITIGAGGPVLAPARQMIKAEDVLVVDDQPGDYSPWVAGTALVTVSDGRLTLTNAPGATNNWLVSIQIHAP